MALDPTGEGRSTDRRRVDVAGGVGDLEDRGRSGGETDGNSASGASTLTGGLACRRRRRRMKAYLVSRNPLRERLSVDGAVALHERPEHLRITKGSLDRLAARYLTTVDIGLTVVETRDTSVHALGDQRSDGAYIPVVGSVLVDVVVDVRRCARKLMVLCRGVERVAPSVATERVAPVVRRRSQVVE